MTTMTATTHVDCRILTVIVCNRTSAYTFVPLIWIKTNGFTPVFVTPLAKELWVPCTYTTWICTYTTTTHTTNSDSTAVFLLSAFVRRFNQWAQDAKDYHYIFFPFYFVLFPDDRTCSVVFGKCPATVAATQNYAEDTFSHFYKTRWLDGWL